MLPRLSMAVDLPTPGTPVMPTRTALPVEGIRACRRALAASRWSGRRDSIRVMAGASAARSPLWTASAVTSVFLGEPPVMGKLYPVPARFSPGDRVHPDSSPAWKLDGGTAKVETRDEPQEVDLEAFHPAEDETRVTPQRNLDAGPARGQADQLPQGLPVLPERGGREGGIEAGDGAHDMRREGVRVGPGPGVVGAERPVGIGCDRLLDLRDQPLSLRAFDHDNGMRRIAEPASVRRPAIRAHRAAPADLVEAGILLRARFLYDYPGVMGEDAAPAPDPRRIDRDDGLRGSCGLRQELCARPIGRAPARRHVVAQGPPEGMRSEREKEKTQDDEEGAGENGEHDGKV